MLRVLLLPRILTRFSVIFSHARNAQGARQRREVEALRRSEEGLARAQAIAHVGSWDWDLKTGRQRWSDELYRIFGLAPRSREGSLDAFLGFIHPEGRSAVEDALKEARAGRHHYCLDHRIVRPDGSERFVHTEGEILRERERPVRMVGTLQDITERTRSEEELRASEERLRTLIESSPDPIFLKDGEGRLLEMNPAARQLFQLEGVDYRGKTDAQLSAFTDFYREALLNCYETDQRTWAVGRLAHVEEVVPRPDGTTRYFDVLKVPLFYPDGRRKSFVVLGRDITERMRAEQERDRLLGREQALARIGQVLVSEVELERIAGVIIAESRLGLGADGVGLWLAHPERRELTMLASFGLSPLTVDALRCLSFDAPYLTASAARTDQLQVIEDSTALGTPTSTSLLATAEHARGVVSIPLHADERLVGVMSYYTREPRALSRWEQDFHAAVGHLFAVALEKARLFQELREALRLREEFMSAAAHELKTPVTAIQTWAQLLLRKGSLSEQHQRGFMALDRNTRRLARLVEHLLAVVQMASGPPKLEYQRFDLGALVEAQAGGGRWAREAPIRVEATRPLHVEADRQRIEEVVAELLEHAIRYSHPGEPIDVTAKHVDGEVVFSVRDHGPSIPPERQLHVFEPFYEPIPPGATGYTGVVSLGLYLSRRIVEAHGGRIAVRSLPGEGTTFTVTLPESARPVPLLSGPNLSRRVRQ
ncbi:PAS domain S-box protein [Myxococcus sp. SDU36]|uniref:sensor histidine kinase n=1 Tax=Myxococcus sp. SDU36 TaxID=2831967 RepID=UPI002543D811|nr:PAS domain S-box protein [Myxococcus sp. SDU36]WIG95725.1 PAS domain S-box protein [Myxococcus sp. SDU36]